jgi:hypothetical protein
MNDLNIYARYNFRVRLSGWLERRAQRASDTGNIERATHLADLICQNKNRLTQESPFEVVPFSN